MFKTIGDVLPRFRTYEKLFGTHERLAQELSVAYLIILKFCTKAKAVFRKAKSPKCKCSMAQGGLTLLVSQIPKILMRGLAYHCCGAHSTSSLET